MRYALFVSIFLLYCTFRLTAQDDDAFYKNFGMNLGYAVAMPKYPALDAYKQHYDAETGFVHNPMQLNNQVTKGLSLGVSLFGFHDYMDFEYRVLASRGTYELPLNGNMKTYTFKQYQHTARYSYNRGFAFGKYGFVGIYAGAAIYAGTFGFKTKENDGKKFNALNMDDFKSFTIGVSPQLTLRLRFFELKAFYDYPFISTNLSPVYNKMFENAQVPGAGSDANLKSKLSNLGVSATFFIAFGEPKPRPEPSPQTQGTKTKKYLTEQDMKSIIDANTPSKSERDREQKRREAEDKHFRDMMKIKTGKSGY